MEKIIFTEKEASEYIGMSRSFLRQDRMSIVSANRGSGPKFLKLGRSVRYHKEDLDIWLCNHRIDRSM